MRGSVFRRGKRWAVQIDRGRQPARRCPACPRVLVWTGDNGPGDVCPRCGGALATPRLERRRDLHSGYATRKEAERARTELLRHLDTGSYVDPSSLTVGGYLLQEWLPVRRPGPGGARHRGQLGVQTWAEYQGDITRYVVPRLGAVRLQELRPAHLNGLYDQLEAAGGRSGRACHRRRSRTSTGSCTRLWVTP